MRFITTRRLAVALTGLALAVSGTGAAIAAGGGGSGDSKGDLARVAERLAAKDEVDKAVAKRLGVGVDALVAAFESAAQARVDAAERAGEITAAQADALRDELAEGHLARRIADPSDVAEKLGVTEAQLTDAFAAEHKAQLKERIDQAVKDGRLTEAQATELKERIDSGNFPGRGGRGPGGFRGGLGAFGGHGMMAPSGFGGHGVMAPGDAAPASLS